MWFRRLFLVFCLAVGFLAASVNGDESPSAAIARPPQSDGEMRFWLENMIRYHGFSDAEVALATGFSANEIQELKNRYKLVPKSKPAADSNKLLVLPYPGGRHPRIGFLEGAIEPQRETKVSVFLPWKDAGYVVADIPEAIWWNNGKERELLYLAHTHVATTWTKQNVKLETLEWLRQKDGTLRMERKLPNSVTFGTEVRPEKDGVKMRMWLTNGTEKTLTGLRVQNCVMFKGAPEFAALTNENKTFQSPYAACKSEKGNRYVITAWSPCQRTWGNTRCPCMHSDPQFPDCPPGKTVELFGWLSFYEGDDLAAELKRLDGTNWQNWEASTRSEE